MLIYGTSDMKEKMYRFNQNAKKHSIPEDDDDKNEKDATVNS